MVLVVVFKLISLINSLVGYHFIKVLNQTFFNLIFLIYMYIQTYFIINYLVVYFLPHQNLLFVSFQLTMTTCIQYFPLTYTLSTIKKKQKQNTLLLFLVKLYLNIQTFLFVQVLSCSFSLTLCLFFLFLIFFFSLKQKTMENQNQQRR